MSRRRTVPWLRWLALVVGLTLLLAGNLGYRPRHWSELRMSVAIPLPAQVALAGGDRYLAANIGAWRALMVGVDKLPRATLTALAMTQADVSFLNPAHEDNYYMAAAILPWAGEVERAQTILGRAIEARPYDAYPPFFYAFDQVHFFGDARGAAETARRAATRVSDVGLGQALTVLAVKWTERGEDLQTAIDTVAIMASRTQDRQLRGFLQGRVKRLEGLRTLREAASRYQARTGRFPAALDDLQAAGDLREIPVDPEGAGYSIVAGTIVLNPPK